MGRCKLLVAIGTVVIVAGIAWPKSALRAQEPMRSLNPLFTEKDAVFEPAIEGTWKGWVTLTFTKLGDNAYQVVLSGDEEGTSLTFAAHLTRLGGSLFLDACLQEMKVKGERLGDLEGTAFWLIPTHTFYRIHIEGDTLRLECLDEGRVKEMIDRGKLKIAHARYGDVFTLTAPTQKHQQLARKYANSEAFREIEELQRQK